MYPITIENLSEIELAGYLQKVGVFPNPRVLQERIKKLSSKATFVVMRLSDSTPIGIIAYYMNTKPLCYITHVSVLQNYRRQGIFSELFHRLEQEVIASGFSTIQLEVLKQNEVAIMSYQRMGFVKTGEKSRKAFI